MTLDEAIELIGGPEVALSRHGTWHAGVPIGVTSAPSLVYVDAYGIPNVIALDGLKAEPVVLDTQPV